MKDPLKHKRDSFRRTWSGVHEIRLLGCKARGRPFTTAGYFDDPNIAAEEIALAEETYEPFGVYWTPNPCDPAVLARSPNKLTKYLEPATSNGDILRRRFLMLDFDPVRPSGVSATDHEVRMATKKAELVRDYLAGVGWGKPFEMMTGNGYRLNYPIDQPNDDASKNLVEDILRILDMQFSNESVKIDQQMANAARIDKVPGTMARKGQNTKDRPHRLSQLTAWPRGNRKPVDIDKLKLLVRNSPSNGERPNSASPDSENELERRLNDAGIKFRKSTSQGMDKILP